MSRYKFFMAFLFAAGAWAQTVPLSIDPATAETHIKVDAPPIYPPIAKAAHVSGTVKLALQIDVSGHVTKVTTQSGPPMLVGAAIEAVKKWSYEPFLDSQGLASPVITTVEVKFELQPKPDSEDESISMDFVKQQNDCVQAVNGHKDSSVQVAACRKIADLADQFNPNSHFITRRSAFVYTAGAYLHNNQPKVALAYANKAVDAVLKGHDDGSGSSAAYSIRAQAETALSDLDSADIDLTKAEDFERSAIKKLGTSDPQFVHRAYVPVLKGLLNFHAQVLTAESKSIEAKAKSDEAAKLN